MRCSPLTWVLAVALAGAAGCKDPETAARQARAENTRTKLAEGRQRLDAGDVEGAIAAARAAASSSPDDPEPYLLIADAQRAAGNDAAAILSLKQAADLSQDASPAIRRKIADLYRETGNRAQAMRLLLELRDLGHLTDPDILVLARLQAQEGLIDGAFKTLELIQRRRPDDPRAKVLEAEILLLKGEELLAANLMDRLVNESGLPEAWLLRARYFLNSGRADLAEGDLARITGEAAERPEVVQLKARVLNELGRHEEAERALRRLLAKNPRDAGLLAQTAETILYQGKPAQAQRLIDEALAVKPRYPRALYVRARSLEAQGELQRAAENYQYALKSDPSFAPALSRIWRIYEHRGEKAEAMSALERLFFMGEASLEEKVALAELYADSRSNVTRGRRLIEEALRRDPRNARYREIRDRLQKLGATLGGESKGPIIIRGGR